MARDPYEVLGVTKGASADEIRRAFRGIAKKDHPDLNPGNAAAEERFKAANAAHDLLSDPDRRARYDRGEIDGAGQERAPERGYYRDHAQSAGARRYRAGTGGGPGPGPNPGMGGGFDPDELGDIFSEFFGSGAGGRAQGPRRGADRRYQLAVPFLEAVNGGTERLSLPDGQVLDVRIPPGLEDGQVLRLRGKGAPGLAGGPEGDALIEVGVRPHPYLRRQGRDLEMDLPVTFAEAVLGARVPVPTPRGEVTLSIPPRSDAGTRLRLRGRGVAEAGGKPAGDLYVTLKLVAGRVDSRLEEFLRGWTPEGGADDPRRALREAGEGG